MKFESDVFQMWLSTTTNTLNAIVKFFCLVKWLFSQRPRISLAMSYSSFFLQIYSFYVPWTWLIIPFFCNTQSCMLKLASRCANQVFIKSWWLVNSKLNIFLLLTDWSGDFQPLKTIEHWAKPPTLKNFSWFLEKIAIFIAFEKP